MDKQLNIRDIFVILQGYLGYKFSGPKINVENDEMSFLLYETFVIKCSIDERTHTIGMGIIINSGHIILDLFGEGLLIDNDRDQVIRYLNKLDNYCRLKLTDKFINAFEEAYKE